MADVKKNTHGANGPEREYNKSGRGHGHGYWQSAHPLKKKGNRLKKVHHVEHIVSRSTNVLKTQKKASVCTDDFCTTVHTSNRQMVLPQRSCTSQSLELLLLPFKVSKVDGRSHYNNTEASDIVDVTLVDTIFAKDNTCTSVVSAAPSRRFPHFRRPCVSGNMCACKCSGRTALDQSLSSQQCRRKRYRFKVQFV